MLNVEQNCVAEAEVELRATTVTGAAAVPLLRAAVAKFFEAGENGDDEEPSDRGEAVAAGA